VSRSVWKGPFVDGYLLEKAEKARQSGRNEVYIRPFVAPGTGQGPTGPVIQVSPDGGTSPKWSADGKELFYVGLSQNLMASAIITANGAFRPTAPVKVMARISTGWSPSRDGKRFLMAPSLDQGADTPITVVTNWEAALQRK